MSAYPRLEYSMTDVRKAGVRLASPVSWTESAREEILDIFKIAHSWRDSHVLPMRSVRQAVLQRMHRARVGGFTAARAKRMASIRRKLIREPNMKLDQINDLAGCRAVVDDIDGVWQLVEACKHKFPHELRKEYDYILSAKPDGYRSYHQVFNFKPSEGNHAYAGRRVELQIRTRLQHSWATAVEAVGLFRNEDLKAGEGSKDWLQLFALMSAEFAIAERCREDSAPVRARRITEIGRLNQVLNAIGTLDDIKNATKYVQSHTLEKFARYFIIKYDQKTRTVEAHPYRSALSGASSFDDVERRIESGETRAKAVLVEVDKANALVEAYPNYFGDVGLFVKNLRSVCDGNQAIEYTMAPSALRKRPKQWDAPDQTWMTPHHRQWTEDDSPKKRKKKKK